MNNIDLKTKAGLVSACEQAARLADMKQNPDALLLAVELAAKLMTLQSPDV